jgi:ketosteroid isomerase-like protein
MSQENMERFRAYHDELLRSSQEGLDPEVAISKMAEFWDPEVEYDMSESPWFDIGGVYRGTDAVRRLWRQWLAAWGTLRFDYELVDAGDRVVVLLDTRMRGRSTGIEVPVGDSAFVTTFRDGLIVHNKLYMSHAEALDAVGQSKQQPTL